MRFLIDFGKVWGGFWERFGTSLASLGALLSVFFQGFVAKRTQEGPRGGQEASWIRFGVDLEGFWEGYGSLLDVKIDVLVVFAAHIVQGDVKWHKIV